MGMVIINNASFICEKEENARLARENREQERIFEVMLRPSAIFMHNIQIWPVMCTL